MNTATTTISRTLPNRQISYFLVALSALLLLGMSGGSVALAEAGDDSYRLGAGDQININVFGEEDLSMAVRLNDDGTLTYPFLGELKVDGLTVSELEQVIVRGLKGPYLVDPDVTISIDEYRAVFMQGEVERPGGYPYQPGLTVEKAVALAGGFTERAARNKIEVSRSDGPQSGLDRVKLTDPVNAGDVITVQQSLF